MRLPNFYAAVFAIIRDEEGKILFQQRQNTGFRDGMFQLPSGHMEGRESMEDALIRELDEELGIEARKEDLEIVHIAHAIAPDRVYFCPYFEVRAYSGTLTNKESEKCAQLVFRSYEEICELEAFAYEAETLGRILAGEKFSEKHVGDFSGKMAAELTESAKRV